MKKSDEMANQIHFENYVQECTESVGNPFGVRSLHTQSNSYTTNQIVQLCTDFVYYSCYLNFQKH